MMVCSEASLLLILLQCCVFLVLLSAKTRKAIDTSCFVVGNKNNCDSFNSVDVLKELGIH